MILRNAVGRRKAPNDQMGHFSLPLLVRASTKRYRWFRSTTQSMADHDRGGEVGPISSAHFAGVVSCNKAKAHSASLSGHWSPSACSVKTALRSYEQYGPCTHFISAQKGTITTAYNHIGCLPMRIGSTMHISLATAIKAPSRGLPLFGVRAADNTSFEW